MVGKTLGHYEILEPLGAGGMSEVYRARDPKLERDVAIQVLPEDFAGDLRQGMFGQSASQPVWQGTGLRH